MPTKRTRVTRNRRAQPADSWQLQFLLTGKLPPDDDPDYNPFDGLDWRYSRKSDPARELWEKEGARLLSAWIRQHPGTRPFAWWRYQAPERRRQIGGSGMAASDKWPAVMPRFDDFGRSGWMVDVNPEDPPVFETEKDYLDRLGLLKARET